MSQTDSRNTPTSVNDGFDSIDDPDDVPSNPSTMPTFGDVLSARLGRREVVRGALGTAAALTGSAVFTMGGAPAKAAPSRFNFPELQRGVDETHHVAEGYDADILIRWGDPVEADAGTFDPTKQSGSVQSKLFGYNNDFIGFVPLPFGSKSSKRGLLCINHEYTNRSIMFPSTGNGTAGSLRTAEVEMACHGGSVLEIRRDDNGKWSVVNNSSYARRITAHTPMLLSGPAAGHARLRTSADPAGIRVNGTVNNCAGGITPWGTYLMAEENFHNYFLGSLDGHPESRSYKRYGIPGGRYDWGNFDRRWNINAEPNEPNRFGWIVEVDPMDPAAMPVKRTALGRFKHEGAETIVNGDGRLVVYSGDDQRFDYVYRFISKGRVDMEDRDANRDLLDDGVLSVAKFEADGSVRWMPLVWGRGPLTPDNGFSSQADILIETRRAADLLGATPMDRPEDVQPNPMTNKVYFTLTNNSKRKAAQLDKVNTRAKNIWGQIVEMTPPDGDHAAPVFRWDILVQCGDPKKPETKAIWNNATSDNGWFACPDNCAVDAMGRLWIATDQGSNWAKASGAADGLWALETDGDRRGTGRMFFRVPIGAELCGPCFTPDDETLFLAIQHPATDGATHYKGFEKKSSFEDPATRWPDFKPGMPPRPSVVAITKKGGGKIGG